MDRNHSCKVHGYFDSTVIKGDVPCPWCERDALASTLRNSASKREKLEAENERLRGKERAAYAAGLRDGWNLQNDAFPSINIEYHWQQYRCKDDTDFRVPVCKRCVGAGCGWCNHSGRVIEPLPTKDRDAEADAEVDRLMALSNAEIRAELQAQGIDPDEAVERVRQVIRRAIRSVTGKNSPYVCTRCGAQYPEPHRRNDC